MEYTQGMMPMSDEAMIVSMQMALSAKTTFMDFLFKNFMVTNGGQFTGALIVTILSAFCSELATYIMATKKS